MEELATVETTLDSGKESEMVDQSFSDIIQKLLELTQTSSKDDTIESFINEEEESRTSNFSTDILEQALENCGLQMHRQTDQQNQQQQLEQCQQQQQQEETQETEQEQQETTAATGK